MSDLSKHLRYLAENDAMYPAALTEAADRIEELEAALREQRAAFMNQLTLAGAAYEMDDIARRALGGEA